MFSGARAAVTINGQVIADLDGCEGSITYSYGEHKPCGMLIVLEHTLVAKRVTLSARIAKRIDADVMQSLGMHVHSLAELQTQTEAVVTIQDASGAVIYVITGVKLASESFGIQSEALSVSNLSFVARDARTTQAVAIA